MAYRTTRARYERRDFRFLMFESSASTEARVNGASAKTSTVDERQSPSLSTNEPTSMARSSAFGPRSGFRGSSILARRRTGHANGASSSSSRLWFFRPKPGFGARLGRAESADRAALDGTSEPSTDGGPRVSELDVPRSRPPSSNATADTAAPATTTSTEDTAGRAPSRSSASSPRRAFARHHPTNTSAGPSSSVPALRASSPASLEIRGRLGCGQNTRTTAGASPMPSTSRVAH